MRTHYTISYIRIRALENEVKRLKDKVQVLEKIQSDFESGDCVRVRDDKLERELKVTKKTMKCVWVKAHDDQKDVLRRKSNIIKAKEAAK